MLKTYLAIALSVATLSASVLPGVISSTITDEEISAIENTIDSVISGDEDLIAEANAAIDQLVAENQAELEYAVETSEDEAELRKKLAEIAADGDEDLKESLNDILALSDVLSTIGESLQNGALTTADMFSAMFDGVWGVMGKYYEEAGYTKQAILADFDDAKHGWNMLMDAQKELDSTFEDAMHGKHF